MFSSFIVDDLISEKANVKVTIIKRIKRIIIIAFALSIVALVISVSLKLHNERGSVASDSTSAPESTSELSYEGEISIEVSNNEPSFSKEAMEKARDGFESYSKLDSLGRCGAAVASVCKETMPAEDEKRTSMGSVYPTGWQSINFWCRCHLIGWQLTAENANEKNLITGTTRMNMSGMLPYENKVAKYIEENPDNHVLYKVEPLFDGNDLVAKGVNMQAESVEDNGKGLSFNVYVFNYQPGYIVDYKDGTVEDDPDHQTTISITDKKASYTGEPISIDEATVEGSTGDIRYIYYVDKRAKERTTEADGAESKGTAPSVKGTYYVRAVVSGDNWYPTAASNVAVLEIR